jgi:hypothetical protein
MSALTGLKLAAAKKQVQGSPEISRRAKLSNQIAQQIELAQALAQGAVYAPTRVVSVKDKDTGERRLISRVKRVKQWWFVADTGRVCLQVRYGTRVLELAKGKNSIEIGSGDELIKVLETVKRAVELGELDGAISAASNQIKVRFVK